MCEYEPRGNVPGQAACAFYFHSVESNNSHRFLFFLPVKILGKSEAKDD